MKVLIFIRDVKNKKAISARDMEVEEAQFVYIYNELINNLDEAEQDIDSDKVVQVLYRCAGGALLPETVFLPSGELRTFPELVMRARQALRLMLKSDLSQQVTCLFLNLNHVHAQRRLSSPHSHQTQRRSPHLSVERWREGLLADGVTDNCLYFTSNGKPRI